MNSFIYDIPTRVYFGENQLSNLSKELAVYGKRVLLCYGGGSIKKIGLYDKIMEEVSKDNLEIYELSGIEPNPRVSSVNRGADICKKENIDVILAVGGGSVIDCAKYIGAGAYYNGDAWDILKGKVDVTKCIPIITVLTLSATGSEMDCGGVISNPDTQEKIGLLFPVMQPKVSFLDPTVTYTVNAYHTACGAADIMSHIFEVYFHVSDSFYMLDKFMEGLLKTVIKYAPISIKEPNNYEARANLMWASSWAINGFVNGGKHNTSWTCHALEHELSAIYDITHGLGLAILTPRLLKYTLSEKNIDKYAQLGINVFDIDKNLPLSEIADKALSKLSDFLSETLGLKSTLTEIGIDDKNFEIMAKKAVAFADLTNAEAPLSVEDVVNIYKMCL